MHPKRLVFILESVSPNGGMVQSVLSLVDKLASLPEFEIIIITGKGYSVQNRVYNKKILFVQSKLKWDYSIRQGYKYLQVGRELASYLKRLPHKETILVSNNVGAAIITSFIRIFFKAKEVYVNRGGNLMEPSNGPRFMRMKLRLTPDLYIVATSQRQRQMILRTGFAPGRISIIHNGVNIPHDKYSARHLSANSLTIGTIGFISEGKNQMEGVRLIKYLRERNINATLNIYGSVSLKIDEEYYNKLLLEISDLNVKDFIHFKGFVPGDEKFQDSDIIISFSQSEGFGRTLAEAMLRRKPVIAWRGAGGPIDITNDGKYGYLVDKNEARAYAEIIQDFLHKPDEMIANIESSYDFAMNNFTTDIMVEKYTKYFREI